MANAANLTNDIVLLVNDSNNSTTSNIFSTKVSCSLFSFLLITASILFLNIIITKGKIIVAIIIPKLTFKFPFIIYFIATPKTDT